MRLRLDSKQTVRIQLNIPPGAEIDVPEGVAADIVAQDAHFKPVAGDQPQAQRQTVPGSTTESEGDEEPKVGEVPGEPTHGPTTERNDAVTSETVPKPPRRTAGKDKSAE